MSQRKARGAPAMPGVGQSPARARTRLLAGTHSRRSRLSRTRQNPWEGTGWSNQRWSRAAPAPGGARAGSLAGVRSEVSPENAARERSRVRTLRQAFLALQAALPAVPAGTKLSKLDVLVLATSYIAHLTRTLGHELPGPAWPPFLRGLCFLHPLKVCHRRTAAAKSLQLSSSRVEHLPPGEVANEISSLCWRPGVLWP